MKILENSGLTLTQQQHKQLQKFTALILEWNKVHNLTGAKTASEVEKNIEDSLFPTTFITPPCSILDVGTGAGFPGLILAIAYPHTPTLLCEPRHKRASFLKYVAMELELNNVTVIKQRVEAYHHHEPLGLISSRAVTNTKMLLQLTQHLQNQATRYLFYKGEQLFDELKDVEQHRDYDIIQKNQRNYLYIKG